MDPEARQRVRKVGGAVVGVGLLGAAVVLAARGADVAALRAVPGWVLPLVAAGVGLNLVATAALMWVMTKGCATDTPVGYREMVAVVAWSGLLNYVPVIRAGLWGRAAYLKRTHGLAVRDSVKLLGVTLGLAGVVLGSVGVLGVVLRGGAFWGAAAAVGMGLTGVLVWGSLRPRAAGLRRGLAWLWVPLRLVDLAAAAGRLWLGFYAVGHVVSAREAVVLTCASLLVKLTGLTPNGLGLSEWAVAAVAAAVSPVSAASAAAAALVDRAVEVPVAIVAGLVGWGALRKRERRDRLGEAAGR